MYFCTKCNQLEGSQEESLASEWGRHRDATETAGYK